MQDWPRESDASPKDAQVGMPGIERINAALDEPDFGEVATDAGLAQRAGR